MTPYEANELMKRMRKGEKVTCPICRSGKMEPIGDYKDTKCFKCSECQKKWNID